MGLLGIGTWIKLGALVALLIGGAVALHLVEEHWRVQGDQRTHAKLDPVIAAQTARADKAEGQIAAANERERELQKGYDDEHSLRLAAERSRDAAKQRAATALDALAARVAADSRVVVPDDVGRVLDAASVFANGGTSGDAAAVGAGSSAAPAIPGSASTYRGTELAGYFTDSAKAFRVADEGWQSCVAQYNGARAKQLEAKGASHVDAQ